MCDYRRGAPGGKLKMTLGLPVYVLLESCNTNFRYPSFNPRGCRQHAVVIEEC